MSDMNQSVSRDSSGQSADLRTRIATLLELLRPVTPMEAADAVIRELRLSEETGWFGPTNIYKRRYVTEWTTP